MTREQWIEETMNSIACLRNVQMPAELPSKIMSGLKQEVPPAVRWAIAASIAALIALNSFTMLQHEPPAAKLLIEEYFLPEI